LDHPHPQILQDINHVKSHLLIYILHQPLPTQIKDIVNKQYRWRIHHSLQRLIINKEKTTTIILANRSHPTLNHPQSKIQINPIHGISDLSLKKIILNLIEIRDVINYLSKIEILSISAIQRRPSLLSYRQPQWSCLPTRLLLEFLRI